MSIEVKNIDPIRVKEKLKDSDCELCDEALKCIEAYERVLDTNQYTTQKAISKIKEQAKELRKLRQ